MGFFSAIGSAFSSACSFVSSAISGLSNFAATIAPVIAKNIPVVGNVFQAVATIFGIFKQDEKMEEMGDRAIQAGQGGIQMENYDEYDDYMDAIRNFEVDPEKSKSITSQDKLIAGVGIVAKGIEEKFNMPAGSGGLLSILVSANPSFFNSNRIVSWVENNQAVDVINYFEGKLAPQKREEVLDSMISDEQKMSSRSEDEIYSEIITTKEALNNQEN